MIINKKIYNERVARQVFIFISNTNRVGLASLSDPAPTREIKMKKINIGHELITNKSNWVGTLKEVNQLLKKVNLKIQFQNSNFYTDDMVHKDQKDISDKSVSEMATEIVLHEIQDDYDYIIKSRDVKKLKELIKKNQEDKKKIEETIKLLKANV